MFKGSNVALITPFKNNGLDEEAYIKLIHFHIDNGTNGLVDRKSTRLNSSHVRTSRMPSSA